MNVTIYESKEDSIDDYGSCITIENFKEVDIDDLVDFAKSYGLVVKFYFDDEETKE